MDAIGSAFVLLIDIDNLMSKFIKENPMYNWGLWSLSFLIISIGFMFASISYYRRNKKISNIFINVSTLLCIMIYFIVINTVNM